MATFDQIKSVRLIINDPQGFIDILSAASASVLPVEPVPQTAYKLIDTGMYMMHDGEAYTALRDLQVSDVRISDWIDSFAESGAVIRGYQTIIQKLGSRLMMVKNSDGAESTEYTSLDKMLAYYRQVLSDYMKLISSETKKSTGRYGQSLPVEIAGGNI